MTEKHDAHTDSDTAGSGDFPAVVDGMEHWSRAPHGANRWLRRRAGTLKRGDVFRWDPDGDDLVMLDEIKSAARSRVRLRVHNVQRDGIAETELDRAVTVRLSQVNGYAGPKTPADLPGTVDGLPLKTRWGYRRETWSKIGMIAVEDVQRGEIISLVPFADARAFGPERSRTRRYVVLGSAASEDGAFVSLDLRGLGNGEEGCHVTVLEPKVWPLSVRLDVVYRGTGLEDIEGRTPADMEPTDPQEPLAAHGGQFVAPVHHSLESLAAFRVPLANMFAQPVQPVAPVNPGSTALADPVPVVRDLDGGFSVWSVQPVHRADGTAVKYRGVPVPAHLLAGWPDSGAAMSWRAGVNDTLRELGMAEVLPLHLRPVAPAASETRPVLPQEWCGDRHTHTAHVWADYNQGRITDKECAGAVGTDAWRDDS